MQHKYFSKDVKLFASCVLPFQMYQSTLQRQLSRRTKDITMNMLNMGYITYINAPGTLHVALTQNTITQWVKNRKLLQMANLDARKMLVFLNDTSLLNSVLLDAGIDTPGDRLEIIITLKTMKMAPMTSAPLSTPTFFVSPVMYIYMYIHVHMHVYVYV